MANLLVTFSATPSLTSSVMQQDSAAPPPLAPPSSSEDSFAWYDLIGPIIGLIFVITIIVAFCKCIVELCQEGVLGPNPEEPSLTDRIGVNGVEDDVPPRYSSSGIESIEMDSNVIVETTSERRRRERRFRVEPEEKLPSYREILEDDQKRKREKAELENPAFVPDTIYEEIDEVSQERTRNENENLGERPSDIASVTSDSDLPPPPPYESD